MKLAILGDAHLIAHDDPYKHLHERRAFFKKAWPSFQRLIKKVNDEGPDLVIFLGDLVDWFSTENIAFGLDLLAALNSPWHMVPGNHDLAAPSDGPEQREYATQATREHIKYWTQQGVDLSNRTLDIQGGAAALIDNSLSDLAAGTAEFLDEVCTRAVPRLLFAHVPIDAAAMRAYILSVDARRSMAKYVLSSAPYFYARYIKNRVPHVFSAHLHFPGDLHIDSTRFHLCTMSISMDDPHRSQSTVAAAKIIECSENALLFRDIIAE